MYFDQEDTTHPSKPTPHKKVYIYENSCNNKQPIEYRIRNHCNVLRDIAGIFKFKRIRLFNQEGAEYFEDDLKFVKNRTILYASRGEEFDPHNCFGEYEIVRKLGQGGFGQVFLANHKHTGEKCAIKIININSSTDIDSIFVQAQILKSLKHQNIVKVTNCLTLKNMQVAIIMQYLQGGQLLEHVSAQQHLDQQACKTFCRQIVKGIMYCHENNLIHRDLKLENIVLVSSEEKRVKIIDFGIAGVMGRLTEDDLDAGSLGYMAPQCFGGIGGIGGGGGNQGVKFDGRMDVWAIGVCIYAMLVGDLPFKGSNNRQVKQQIKKSQYKIPPQIKKSLTKQCLNVIYRCLDPNPKTRIKIGQLMNHAWFADKFKIELQSAALVGNCVNVLVPSSRDKEREKEKEREKQKQEENVGEGDCKDGKKVEQVEIRRNQEKGKDKDIGKCSDGKQNVKDNHEKRQQMSKTSKIPIITRNTSKNKSLFDKTRKNTASLYQTKKSIQKNSQKQPPQKLRT